MSCNSNTPNINKTFIIEPLSLTGGSPTLSACTSLYTNLIQSCSGDATIQMGTGLVTFNSNVNGINSFTANAIEANTYLSGGTNILDIINTNDTFITGGTFNDVSDTLTLLRNDGASVVIGGLANYYVTGGTYNNSTGLITFDRNDTLSAFTVDLSTIDVNDTFVTGGTLTNAILTITRNDGVDIVVTGFSQTFTGNTSGTCIGDIYVSNIHSCSPLHINSNDEGNVYFGSNSGVTIDVINSKLGIGTTTPTAQLEVNPSSALSTHEVANIGSLQVRGNDTVFNRGAGDISTNTAFGELALRSNTTGERNTANGFGTLNFNTTGDNNTANGRNALYFNTTGNNNTANGVNALLLNTEGNNNTANGVNALPNNTTGSTNIANGYQAGRYTSTGADLTVTNNSVFIGFDTRAQDNNQTNQIVIGHSGIGLGSNTTRIGNDDTTLTRLDGQLQLDDVPTGTSVNNLGIDASGNVIVGTDEGITGSGTLNYVPKFTPDGSTLDDSVIYDDGTNVGIGTTTPSGKLEVVQNTEKFTVNLDNINGPIISVSTTDTNNLVRLGATDGISSINIGTVGSTWTGSTGFGSQTDSYIYSNSASNGLNIISQTGVGTKDYIRFYAGGNPLTNTSSIHIQGSGGTKGYIGIGTETPMEKLHVNGNTLIGGNLTANTINLTNTPTLNNSNTEIISRNTSTGEIEYTDLSAITALTSGDIYVTGQTFNNSSYILSTTRNDGNIINTDLSVLASDIYVLSGVYDVSTGVVTYTNNSGGTFQVSGFTTGMTDSYTNSANINGETIEFNNNIQGSNLYSVDLTPLLSGKTNNTDFNTHTGDTSIHFTKSSINLSDLGSTAHTHTLSEITDFNSYSGNVETQLNNKTNLTLFNTHTGDTNNPHQTSFNNLISTAHTHTISEITDFNTYSGNVQTELNTKISGATNLSSEGIFAQKNGLDLEFKGLTSTGGTVNISSNSSSVNLEVTFPTDQDKFVSGGTYNSGSKEINFVGNSVETTFDVDLTTLVSSVSANTYVIDGVYIDSTDTLSLLRNDGNFVNITGITDTFTTGATYDNGTTLATFTKNDGTTYTLDLSTIDVNDTFVTGQTFSNSTYVLSTTRNDGTTFNTDLSVLASDVYVVSGVYDVSTGVVTYTNSSGGTFQVSGFTTGMTDSYTTAANLNGETIEFDNNIQGSNLYSVNLSPVLSGKTNLTLFNSHTGDTTIHFTKSSINLSDLGNTAHTHTISEVVNLQTELDSKTDLSLFNSHTGDTNNPHQTSFSNLTNTAHTHTISEITDFNTYSGSVQTQLNTKIENGINSGGANEVFSGKSGNDLYFRTISGGSNTNITTINDIIKVDVSVPVDTNTYVTGFTYDDVNTFTIGRNDGVNLTSTISVLSGITYYGDGSNLSGISTDNFYVTGGTYSSGSLTLDRNDGGNVIVTGFLDGDYLPLTGGTVNGDVNINGQTILTNSGQNTLTIIGSGDTEPILLITGSTGELFSVTDTSDGTIYQINDSTANTIFEVNSDTRIVMGSYNAPSLYATTGVTVNSGSTIVYSFDSTNYDGVFVDYTLISTLGARSGNMMGVFSGNTIQYTETSTNDIGDTSSILLSMSTSGNTTSINTTSTTNGWTVKTIIRSI